jgi:dihydrofolate reductase
MQTTFPEGHEEEPDGATNSPLVSGVLTSPADAMLSHAIARTLEAQPAERARLFARLVREIEDFMRAHPAERPWTCNLHIGTDGSHIFRGGVGHSLVVDPAGRLWRARSYEDFDTTYRFENGTCEIDQLTPRYDQMREYLAGRTIQSERRLLLKTSVFVGTSVDGFIARLDGAFDFLTAGGGERDNGYEEFFASVDVLIVGRNTYDVCLAFPTWPYGPKPVVVLSNRPIPEAPSGSTVERMSGSPADILSAVEARGFRHAYVDGGLTVQSFLRAGLIQRLVITRVPVLIGTGIPLFGPVDADIRLEHVITRQLSGGAVQSEYMVKETNMGAPA